MTQAPVSHSVPTIPHYDCTLVLAIELSNKSWVLAAQVPGLPRVKAKRTIEPRLRRCWPPSRATGSGPMRLAGILSG